MARFKLVSEMTPKGDQPQAIRKLVEGIRRQERFQTLLGATGTGKSLPPEESIWIYERKSRKLSPKLLPIGSFVDQQMEGVAPLINGDTETVRLSDKTSAQYYALSLDPDSLRTEIQPIHSVHRHRAPTELWTVTTSCGRSVRVTGDHNLWILRDGRLRLVQTGELQAGDYLPLPITLVPPDASSLESIPLLGVLDDESRVYVECQKQVARLSGEEMWKLGRKLSPESQQSGYNKLKRVTEGERLSVTQARILESEGIGIDLQQLSLGSKNDAGRLPMELPITDAFLELLGYYLAEGHAEDRYLIISCDEKEIQGRLEKRLGDLKLKWSVRSNGYDYQCSWSLYTRFLTKWCGQDSHVKHLPDFWPQMSDSQLALLLSAYFTGDGGAERESVRVTTASSQLASELAYALARFGIHPRIRRRFQRATNSEDTGDWYYCLSISGQEQLDRFSAHINFLSERKCRRLRALLGKEGNTNADFIPIPGGEIRQLRILLGWHQKVLANHSNCSRSLIGLIESGQRRPSRNLFNRLIASLESGALEQEHCGVFERISVLKRLGLVRWSAVKTVSQQPSDCEWVYDLNVPGNETFLAGFGGLFVHNTFTMAGVIEQVNLPALILSHNKTLAAQLYSELKSFFPENAVEYFVSYYDYYQPEAYIPQTDTYIEKDSSINDRLDRLRLAGTTSLMSREDVIIVASVSCIYNLGDPQDYKDLLLFFETGQEIPRQELLHRLVGLLYERNDIDFMRGRFRVRGETVEIFPAYQETAVRLEMFGDRIERISVIDPVAGKVLQRLEKLALYPAKHFITTAERIEKAAVAIEQELQERLKELKGQGKLLEAQRLESRTHFDLEMMREVGFCHGIENYSRALSGRPPGSRPWCLLDYFPKKFLTVIDESHVTIPQIRGMYEGDRARKRVLVDFGFRLPSCLDNRPLTFEEFQKIVGQQVFVSATPSPYEMKLSQGQVVEQIIRPTGLVDPEIEVRPLENQVDDLIHEIRERAKLKERSLVTTLTKRMAEELAAYLKETGLQVTYIHSDLDAFERVEVLKNLRLGKFDCVVGVNLLREGLDLPEVSLVCVLDADKEGFLRSPTSLIQLAGRAARNIRGKAILYADRITASMRQAMDETGRRRKLQVAYNERHGITPRSVEKAIREGIETTAKEEAQETVRDAVGFDPDRFDIEQVVAEMEREMEGYARNLQFERAAAVRDQIAELREKGVAGLALFEDKLLGRKPTRSTRWKNRF